mgnify:CR=1 FL=1
MLEIFNHTQGTPEWHESRCGIITASCFSDVLAKGAGKTRRTYMLKLAGERITGNVADNFSNAHMERGHEQESIARSLYEEQQGIKIIQCGFMKHGSFGYSPDGLIGDDGLLEIKTKLAHLQAAVLIDGEVPSEHIAQIQGGLMVSGRRYLDFVSFCPGMPFFIKRVERDEAYIANLHQELMKFEDELNATIKILESKF